MAVKIGGADGGYTKKKNFKIKDGDNIYRILPSLGFNGKEPDGKPFKFYNVHFGYKNSAGKMRVFQSPEVKNRESKMIEVEDAAKTRIETLKAQFEAAKANRNKAEAERLLPLIAGKKPMYNLDNNHHCNAINEAGEIGVLKIRHRAKLALDAVIKQLRAKGVEPLGPEGRYFVINRSGTGLETTFTVKVLTKDLEVAGVGVVQQEVVHKLTDDIIKRLDTEAADLDSLYPRPTAQEVARIVAESELATGKSRAVDEILDKKGNEAQVDDDGEDGEEEPQAAAPATQSLSQPAPAATQAAAPAAAKVQVSTPASAAKPVQEQSDEEFLKSLGV